MLEQWLGGFAVALQPASLLYIVAGVAYGIVIGAMPGLTTTMGAAVLIPLTFSMNSLHALLLLGGTYAGAMFGGAIPSVLINTPGTAAAAATAMDGHPLAKQGKAAQAIGVALIASFVGGLFSAIALMTVGPILGRFALRFGPPEMFMLALLGLTAIVSLSSGNYLKGVASGAIGLLLGLIGSDPVTGYPRFVFGKFELYGGLPLVPTLIGLLAVSQLLVFAEVPGRTTLLEGARMSGRFLPEWRYWPAIIRTMIRSALIGTGIGIIPGEGGSVAAFLAYSEAKRASRQPEWFGKGSFEGVAAPESANNAVSGGAFITTLTLGIPGSATTAVIVGALMMHGLVPGPSFFRDSGDVAFPFMAGLVLANFVMLGLGLLSIRAFAPIVLVPNYIVIPVAIALSASGAYALQNNLFDVQVLVLASVLGYLMLKAGLSPVTAVLGFILAPIAEKALMQTMILSNYNVLVWFERPLSVLIFALTILVLAWPFLAQRKKRSSAPVVEASPAAES